MVSGDVTRAGLGLAAPDLQLVLDIDPREISIPGMAVWGESDLISSPHNAAWLHRRRPDLETAVDKGPHSLQSKYAERFAHRAVHSKAYARRKSDGYRHAPVPDLMKPAARASASISGAVVAAVATAALGAVSGLRARRSSTGARRSLPANS